MKKKFRVEKFVLEKSVGVLEVDSNDQESILREFEYLENVCQTETTEETSWKITEVKE